MQTIVDLCNLFGLHLMNRIVAILCPKPVKAHLNLINIKKLKFLPKKGELKVPFF